MEENTKQSHETEGETAKSGRRDPVEKEHELRLVLLGWTGSGKSSVGNAILCFKEFETRRCADSEKPVTVKCEKKCASLAGRKVTVVDTPDWFYTELSPEEVHHQLSLCESLLAPGPHAFLLCVPVHRSNVQDLQAVDALEKVFGPESVSKRTIVLFTYTEHLPKDLVLEEYFRESNDLLELVEKCGNRYQVFTLPAEGEKNEEKKDEERKSVEQLLEKVEEMVKENIEEFYIFPPLLQTDLGVSGRDDFEGNKEEDLSAEIVRRRGREKEEERSGDMAEESADGLEVVEDEDSTLSPSSPPPSFLHWLWDSVVGWVMWLPSLVRGSTLLGSFVGLFVGGVFGGVLGTTVGSVATEVGRRKPQKTKTK